MIVEQIMAAQGAKIKQYPVKSNRASELGHPCVLYHVYNRTRGEERTLHDANVQLIFSIGNMIEDLAIGELQDAGFRITEQQRPFEWKEYQITGTVDCKILIDDVAVPAEIKSCSPYMFDKINTIDDLTKGKYLYLRKYPSQLNLYLLMDNKEKGIFLFKNKSNGQYKEIWMNLDYALGEELLKRAEGINKHVANKTLPDPIEYDDDICGKCGYVHICPVLHVGKEVNIMDDEELAGLLAEHERLKQSAKDYEAIERTLKDRLKEQDKVIVGDFYITGKWVEKKAFLVPESRYWQKKIIRYSRMVDGQNKGGR